MKYTYRFEGIITVKADNEQDAYEIADEISGITAYQWDNCEDISIGELTLIDKEEEE